MSWSRFFRRSRWDDERARELEAHLDHEIDDNIARGMTPQAALGLVSLLAAWIPARRASRLAPTIALRED